MASVSSPYGFQPISDQSGPAPRTARMFAGIASGYNTAIFKGQPVTLNPATGLLQAVTATNQQVFGIFAGVEYTPLGGSPAESSFWPAGTVVDPAYDFLVYYYPAWIPSYHFRVQSTGSVAQTGMGAQFSIANATAGNTQTGLSACGVGAPIAVGLQGQFFMTAFFDTTGIYDTIGDAFTDIIVGCAWPQVGAAAQLSIG